MATKDHIETLPRDTSPVPKKAMDERSPPQRSLAWASWGSGGGGVSTKDNSRVKSCLTPFTDVLATFLRGLWPLILF